MNVMVDLERHPNAILLEMQNTWGETQVFARHTRNVILIAARRGAYGIAEHIGYAAHRHNPDPQP
jgi:hypothetical protein